MSDVQIDRLTIRTPMLSDHDARRLATLVADAVSRWSLNSGAAVAADHLEVGLTVPSGHSVEQLAASVAAAIESAVQQAEER